MGAADARASEERRWRDGARHAAVACPLSLAAGPTHVAWSGCRWCGGTCRRMAWMKMGEVDIAAEQGASSSWAEGGGASSGRRGAVVGWRQWCRCAERWQWSVCLVEGADPWRLAGGLVEARRGCRSVESRRWPFHQQRAGSMRTPAEAQHLVLSAAPCSAPWRAQGGGKTGAPPPPAWGGGEAAAVRVWWAEAQERCGGWCTPQRRLGPRQNPW